MKGMKKYNDFVGENKIHNVTPLGIQYDSTRTTTPNWNISGDNQIKRTFKIPVGNLSKEEAEIMIREIMEKYKEPLNIDKDFIPIKENNDNGEVWIPVRNSDDEKGEKYIIKIEDITPKIENKPWYKRIFK